MQGRRIGGRIFLFMDAAWTTKDSAVAIAIQDGKITLRWYKKCHSYSPAQSEAAALLLAARIAKKQKWPSFVPFWMPVRL